MRRETTGGLLPVLAALLLAVPPTLRWCEIQFGARPRDQMAPSETVVSRSNGTPAGREALNYDLQQLLRVAEADLNALGVVLDRSLYSRVLARRLPFHDPSPARSALYLALRTLAPIPGDCAVVSAEHLMVGRVVDVTTIPGKLAVAHVQTILDPGFRVRFVADGARGLLGGTGESTPSGQALLEILFSDQRLSLEADIQVVTDGADGVYPSGLVIGKIDLKSRLLAPQRSSGLPLVRAEVILDTVREMVVLPSRMPNAISQEIRAGLGANTRRRTP